MSGISREVQEFGILGNEFKVGGGEPGARGAAWTYHLMMVLCEAGMDRLWSWGALEPINLGDKHQLLTGTGWVSSVLEQTVGSDAYSLEPVLKPVVQDVNGLSDGLEAIAAFERPRALAKPGSLFVKSNAFVQRDRTFIITSAYHEDRFVTDPVDVTLTLPRHLLPTANPTRVRSTALTRTGAVHYRIRRDLADAGLLDTELAAVPGLLSSVKTMGDRPAWEYVDANWSKYERIIQGCLTLKSFEGRAEATGDGQRITFRMAPPAVMVAVIDNGGN